MLMSLGVVDWEAWVCRLLRVKCVGLNWSSGVDCDGVFQNGLSCFYVITKEGREIGSREFCKKVINKINTIPQIFMLPRPNLGKPSSTRN